MRWLIKVTGKTFTTLIVGALLTICSIGGLSEHANAETINSKASCSASCHAHGQAGTLNSIENKDEDDDKEPAPPHVFWQPSFTNLADLYIAPVFSLVPLGFLFRKFLLSTQLRF